MDDPLADLPPLPALPPITRLTGLSPRWRWVAVRRHPFDVWAWERARRYRETAGAVGGGPMDVLLGGPGALSDLHAHAGLNMLAVVGLPVDPAAEIDDAAAASIAPTVGQPAYRPPVRDPISLLLRLLPGAELRVLFALAAEAGGGLRGDAAERPAEVPDEDGIPVGVGRTLAADQLGRVARDALDEPLDIPLFFIKPFERKAATEAAVEERLAAFRDRSPELADAVRRRASSDRSLSRQFAASSSSPPGTPARAGRPALTTFRGSDPTRRRR